MVGVEAAFALKTRLPASRPAVANTLENISSNFSNDCGFLQAYIRWSRDFSFHALLELSSRLFLAKQEKRVLAVVWCLRCCLLVEKAQRMTILLIATA